MIPWQAMQQLRRCSRYGSRSCDTGLHHLLFFRSGPQPARQAAVSVAAADVAIRPGFLWSPQAAAPSQYAADPTQPQRRSSASADDRNSHQRGEVQPDLTGRQEQAAAATAGITPDCQDVACVIGHFSGAPGSTFAGTLLV